MISHIRLLPLIALLSVVTVLTLTDFYIDYRDGEDAFHLLVEGLVIATSIFGIAYLTYELFKHKKELARLGEQLRDTKKDLSESRAHLRKAGQQYTQAIQQQFATWALTPSERDVATLLLKGLSFEEIAGVRQTKEKTVRQQATAIYRKAGLNGRHEFAAWFFEDFMQTDAPAASET